MKFECIVMWVITRATYGGTESRFTDGSVVVLVLFFYFFFHVELLQLIARARNILSTWCGRLSWKSFLLPKIKSIELFDR